MTTDLARTPRPESRKRARTRTSIELFTGAGGLALGVQAAGFEHICLVELDTKACETIRINNMSGVLDPAWPIEQIDVSRVDFTQWHDRIDLIAAGVPCQPFSLGGRHLGHNDRRNLFPQAMRAVREVAPKLVLLENVKGIVRSSFLPYFEYVLWQLERPDLEPRRGEEWLEHKHRLQRERTKPSYSPMYRVEHRVVNAADFGIPQRRARVIIVAIRDDSSGTWAWPNPTHSADALLYSQWVDGSYWREHGLRQPSPPAELGPQFTQLASAPPPPFKRWRTVRDALRGLPPPTPAGVPSNYANHHAIAGARQYKGHEGSRLDDAAKTLKAGVHGVPGGEGTVILDDGSVRYFTVREAAKIQTFPDAYVFFGARSHAMRQIGNAVPVDLAQVFAERLRRTLV